MEDFSDTDSELKKEQSAGKDSLSTKSDSAGIANDYKKFSDFLTSPVFSIVVGDELPKIFLLHEALFHQESDRLAKAVKRGFKEAEDRKIVLDEEDAGLFGYFVEYLYRTGWIADENGVSRNEDYIVLARLYTLGERLQAKYFQRAALNKFYRSFKSASLSHQEICDLLVIACTELPERVDQDPLRAQIFWSAASRLAELRDYPYFRKLLADHADLGNILVLLAGNSSTSLPQYHQQQLREKFVPESQY